MKRFRKVFFNLALFVACFTLMSVDDTETSDLGESVFWGWGTMGCAPSGASATELYCRQCYYVLWIAVDCRTCTNYMGSSSNTDCRNQ